MAYKFSRDLIVCLTLLFVLSAGSNAQEQSNTVNGVKVQSVGEKAVVVDVYINSKDARLKPELTTRKYNNNKYVIDLMNVTNKGGVSKDTSSSSGLVSSGNVKVGNLAGGTARVVLDLNNPDVQVKDVRYHIIPDKSTSAKQVASNPPAATQSKPVVSKPVAHQAPVVKPVGTVAKKQESVHAAQTVVKNTLKPVSESIQPVIEHKGSTKPVVIVKKDPLPSPQISHKTAVAPSNTRVTAPDDYGNKKTAVKKLPVEHSVTPNKPVAKPTTVVKPVAIHHEAPKPVVKPPVIHHEAPKPVTPPAKRVVLIPVTEVTDHKQPVEAHESGNNSVNEHKSTEVKPVVAENAHKPVETPKTETAKPVDPEHLPINLDAAVDNQNIRTLDTNTGNQDMGSMFLTLLGALAIVIPLIFGALWLINMFYKGGSSVGLKGLQGFSDSENFKIVASTSLGQGKSVHLLEIRGRQLVVGCTSNSINILTEFDDFDEFIEEQKSKPKTVKPVTNKPQYKKGHPQVGSFAQLYRDYTSKVNEQELEDEY